MLFWIKHCSQPILRPVTGPTIPSAIPIKPGENMIKLGILAAKRPVNMIPTAVLLFPKFNVLQIP